MGRAIKRVIREGLIYIDDIGLLTVSNDNAEALYRVTNDTYEKNSNALNSNRQPAGFTNPCPRPLGAEAEQGADQ